MSMPTAQQDARLPAVCVALAFAVFIAYGTLFPFQFVPTAQPWQTVFNEWNPLLNRADAIDNIMLFVPFGAALWFACRSARTRCGVAVASWLLLGAGVQVLQLHVPGRVASMADAINNAAGLLIGLSLARVLEPWLRRKDLVGRPNDSLALLLVAFWFVYEAFPFVPTLDVGLLAAHIKPALTAPEFDLLRWFRHAIAAALGTLLLLAARPLRSRFACVATALAVLFAAEVLVPYGQLHIETLLGMASGALLGERLEKRLGAQARWVVLMLAAVALSMTVLTAFRGPPGSAGFTFAPFSRLLWHGATSGVPTAAFEALATGALMWAGTVGSRPIGAKPWYWPAIVIAGVVGLECLRVFLASGPADTGTLVLALVLAPFAARLHRRSAFPTPPNDSVPAAAAPLGGQGAASGASVAPMAWGHRAVVVRVVAVWLILTIGLRLLLELPDVPYNVRELFASHSVVHAGLFAAALLWLGAGPWCIVQWRVARTTTSRLLWLPLLLLLVALVSLFLVGVSVTAESLDDITGSTDLYRRITADNYWGVAWQVRVAQYPAEMVSAMERCIRYIALYSLLLAPLTMATLCVYKPWPMVCALPALGVLALWWWLTSWVVIDGAVTDNLTELMAHNGGWWLAVLSALFALHACWASRRMSAQRGWQLGAITLMALPLSWWLLKQGLEQTIVKYDSVWSAQQFLLGRDRRALLSESALFMRWSALYIAMVGCCTLGMSLARQLWSQQDPRATARPTL